MNIYETCPTLESEKYILRSVKDTDCDDLLTVYSDKRALPFFNSDNCDGDNFYYDTKAQSNLSAANRYLLPLHRNIRSAGRNQPSRRKNR